MCTVKYEHFIFSVFRLQQTSLLMSSVFGKEFLYDLEKNDVKTPQTEEPSFQHEYNSLPHPFLTIMYLDIFNLLQWFP